MPEKIIGVLGGMGPEATIELFAQIVRRTRAKKDRDHLRVLIDNNPKVPDRTAAILHGGESCLPELARSARALKRAGADFIVIPCVTVHYFHGALQKRTSLPVLHIIEETVKRIRRGHPGVRRVGLLATTGTIQAGLFQQALAGTKLELLTPTEDAQKNLVMKAIYAIKAEGANEGARSLVRRAADDLVERGAQIVIAGCTEIPLVLKDGDLPVPVIDPIAILADAAIDQAGGKRRKASPDGRRGTPRRAPTHVATGRRTQAG
jgi:aspartate racemase